MDKNNLTLDQARKLEELKGYFQDYKICHVCLEVYGIDVEDKCNICPKCICKLKKKRKV